MDSEPKDSTPSFADRSYALSGRIMLSAIVVLFFVVIVMICLHVYARWYLLRARRRQMRRRSRRATANLVFYVDPDTANPANAAASSRGLEASVLKSLPVFVYSVAESKFAESMECAVCLSEFEEKEKGRTLPQCKHSFHTECIDMWFHSHSTCPLCRSPVEPVTTVTSDVELVSPSDMCNSCADHVGPSTSAGTRKPVRDLDVRIDVPRRNVNFGDEPSSAESPASQGFRSPMSWMLSFTRILSRDWRGNNSSSNLSPRSPIPTSCGGTSAVSEEGIVDLERGKEEAETRPSSVNELPS